jgi:hypothetical protein
MPGAAPSLKRFARHSHAVQHQDGATATRAVRAMTLMALVRELSPCRAVEPRAAGARLWRADLTRHGDHGYDIELSSVHE